MNILKLRRKPEEVTAVVWDGDNIDEILQWTQGAATYEAMSSGDNRIVLNLGQCISIGDYIIKKGEGDFITSKPASASITYDLILQLP